MINNEMDFWRRDPGGLLTNEVSAIIHDDKDDCGMFSLGFKDD